MEKNNKYLNRLIAEMSLDQKVGALMTLGFCGVVLSPADRDKVIKYHCSGLRLTPSARTFGTYVDPKTGKALSKGDDDRGYKDGVDVPYVTPSEYKKTLNELQTLAMARPSGIPLHFSLDQGGGCQLNYNFGGVNIFPTLMGIRATGDPKMAYEVALARAKQCKAVGFNWIHQPVLDIKANPDNPEICTSAFSDRMEDVIEYAIASYKGYKDGGIISVGKHFPGLGAAETTSHFDKPIINVDKETLLKRDILPYKELIKQNLLPTIMVAHAVYPAFDEKDVATVSKPIVTGLIREELGFEGVITTDSMTMIAIARAYGVANACALALEAGADLVLMKGMGDLVGETFEAIKSFVEKGRISENELNDKVYRVLKLKYEYGFFHGEYASNAVPEDVIKDEKIVLLAKQAAKKSILVARNRKQLLPLSKEDDKVLVIEQINRTPNNICWHPGLFFENCLKHNPNAKYLEIDLKPDEEDKERIKQMLPKFDTIIMTNYFAKVPTCNEIVKEIEKDKSKKLVMVTDIPYKLSIPDEVDTAVVMFGVHPENMAAAADVIFGEARMEAEWPLAYTLPE